MINISINICPDSDYVGKVTFHKDLIYIGNNLSADLYIPDNKIITNHLFLEIIDNKLIAHSHKKVENFWVNGKRTKSFKFLNIGDKIEIGESEIEIVLFASVEIQDKRMALNERTDILINQKQELIPLVKALQEKI
jgi:hypothetical protein